ncbi:hypothetical protein [Microbacterium sp. NPDC057650]|uniref:hypothetical protein n=1 Tax=unclassified Microbacterium TaxID=2609290 RepID=UPI003671581E
MLFVLTSCSVAVHGWVGLQRGESNSLSAIVQMCEESVDGATLYASKGGDGQPVGRAEFDSPITDSGQVVLASLQQLDTRVTYSLYGWTNSSTSAAAGFSFEREDVAAVSPGKVLAKDLDDPDLALRSFTPGDFSAMVLAHCDD